MSAYSAWRCLMSFMMVSATTALTEAITQIRNHKTNMGQAFPRRGTFYLGTPVSTTGTQTVG